MTWRQFREGRSPRGEIIASMYPEVGAGGFTCIDGTVEFYSRVNALLRGQERVLDFGAGNGSWLFDDPSIYRRELRHLKTKVATVVACDVDEVVLSNESAHESYRLVPGEQLPFRDEEFDLVVCDFVFEHLYDPTSIAIELGRVVRPGGWLCARTPNRYGYLSLAAQLVPKRFHLAVLRRAQRGFDSRVKYETHFALNTMSAIRAHFPRESWKNCSYYFQPDPAYYFSSRLIARSMAVVNRLLPPFLRANIFVFLRKC